MIVSLAKFFLLNYVLMYSYAQTEHKFAFERCSIINIQDDLTQIPSDWHTFYNLIWMSNKITKIQNEKQIEEKFMWPKENEKIWNDERYIKTNFRCQFNFEESIKKFRSEWLIEIDHLLQNYNKIRSHQKIFTILKMLKPTKQELNQRTLCFQNVVKHLERPFLNLKCDEENNKIIEKELKLQWLKESILLKKSELAMSTVVELYNSYGINNNFQDKNSSYFNSLECMLFSSEPSSLNKVINKVDQKFRKVVLNSFLKCYDQQIVTKKEYDQFKFFIKTQKDNLLQISLEKARIMLLWMSLSIGKSEVYYAFKESQKNTQFKPEIQIVRRIKNFPMPVKTQPQISYLESLLKKRINAQIDHDILLDRNLYIIFFQTDQKSQKYQNEITLRLFSEWLTDLVQQGEPPLGEPLRGEPPSNGPNINREVNLKFAHEVSNEKENK